MKWLKHLEVCKKYREANRDKVRNGSLDSYYRKKSENPMVYLKRRSEIARRYRLRNLEESKKKEKEKSRLRRLINHQGDYEYMKKYLRKRTLDKKYNISLGEYDQMYSKQAGKCTFCEEDFGNKTPHIDHSHLTGKVRSLLCGRCNMRLGWIEKMIKVNPFFLSKLTEYLK